MSIHLAEIPASLQDTPFNPETVEEMIAREDRKWDKPIVDWAELAEKLRREYGEEFNEIDERSYQ